MRPVLPESNALLIDGPPPDVDDAHLRICVGAWDAQREFVVGRSRALVNVRTERRDGAEWRRARAMFDLGIIVQHVRDVNGDVLC